MAQVINDISRVVFLDVNGQYGINLKPELLADQTAINGALVNLLSCPVGTRPFLRQYGSNIMHLLQEPVDTIGAESVKQNILQAIRRWEPRISLDYGNTIVQPLSDGSGYLVELAYTVLGVNVTGNLEVNLIPLL
jgi:phage baseplate assembly protein W